MWHETAAHSHPWHRTTVPSHLRRRSRCCENACYYATKKNDFFRVHNFVPFLKIEPVRILKVSPLPHLKGNAVVTIPMPCSSSARCRCPLSPRGSTASSPKTAKALTQIWS